MPKLVSCTRKKTRFYNSLVVAALLFILQQASCAAAASAPNSGNEDDGATRVHFTESDGTWKELHRTEARADRLGTLNTRLLRRDEGRSTRSLQQSNYVMEEVPQVWKTIGLESASLARESSHDNLRRRPASNCPHDCRCGEITGITCYAPDVDTPLPKDFPSNTRVLTLYGYKTIARELEHLSELEKLNIYDGNTPNMPSLPSSITHLDIINSNLRSIDNIDQLPYLQSLNAAYNNLTKGNLRNLAHLISLDLSHNPLQEVPKLPQSLTVLNLKGTPLSQQPPTWDIYLPNLKKLVLTGIQMIQPPYLTLPKLEYFDISHSSIKLMPYLSGLPNLKEIDVSFTDIHSALQSHFNGPTGLRRVDLSHTPISRLPDKLFIHNPKLKEIFMHNTNVDYIRDYTFSGLYNLEELILKNTPNLTHVDDISLRTLHSLKVFDISNSQVKVLPYSMNNTDMQVLNAMNVTFLCDCHSLWLPDYLSTIENQTILGLNPMKCDDGISRTPEELSYHLKYLGCAKPQITSEGKTTLRRGVGKTALLECNSTGVPNPLIIWHSPDKKYYSYNHTEIQPWFSDKFKYILEHLTNELSDPPIDPRIQPLKSGHLLIQNLTREDVGLYRCTAVNAAGSVTTTTFLWLTTTEMVEFQIETLLFGLACAMAFLLTTLIVQLIRYIMDRMGWECCCCRGRISSKAQQVKRLLESVESYKSQQLDRLRENYNSQVVSIKESCYLQMEKLSESYSKQCENLQNIKDYSAQQLTTVRDQYLDQINRVRDYSLGQMNRVSENYVFQRQRIRKFSAHQMFKLRETYKYQQKTLNKILENIPDLYLQNCRTGGNCNRTDSIIFDDEIHGIDAYYRLDFLNPIVPSYEGSEDCYFTPSSTLTRTQRQHLVQQHKRQLSNCSTNFSNNDYHEAVQSWATNTPATSPANSPSHLTSELYSPTKPQHPSKHGTLKHTRSLSISTPNKGYIPTHRRTHSANNNQPVKVHQKPTPPLVEKIYWVQPKGPLKSKSIEEAKAGGKNFDSDGSDNEHTAMLSKDKKVRSDENIPQCSSSVDSDRKYIKLVSQKSKSEETPSDSRRQSPPKVPQSVPKSIHESVSLKAEPIASKDSSVLHSSANKDSRIKSDNSKLEESATSARRKSLSRESSNENEGRCVLPSVSEDKEPTPSSSEFQW